MNRESLDDMIRKALEKVESDQRHADWEAFASKMDMQDPKSLDSFVKDNLEKIQPYSTQAWNSFEDKFAEELGHEHPVDQKVKSNLAGHEAPYSESSWYRLSSLLDLTDRRERDLLIRKVSEVLTISLLLFILIPQLFIHNDKQPAPSKQFAVVADIMPVDKLPHLIPDELQVSSSSYDPSLLIEKSNEGDLQSVAIPPSVSGSNQLELPHNNIQNNRIEPLTLLPTSAIGLLKQPIKNEKPGKQKSLISPFAGVENPTIPAKLLLEGSELVASSSLTEINPAGLQALSGIPTLELREFSQDEALAGIITLQNNPKRRGYRLSVFHTPRLTHVFTPYDEVYDNASYGRMKVFRASGIEVEKRNGKVTIGGSVSYGQMDYRPPVVLETYGGNLAEVNAEEIYGGYRSLSLSNINMSMASASLFLRHFYPISQNLRWFSHFGGGINMVLTTDFLVQDIIDHSDGTFTETEFILNDTESSAATEHVRLRQKNFEGGILEGGNFNRNSFMDIELGAGLEYDLNPRSTLFLASVFNLSPFADGLGPNKDKVNSLDLKLGLRYWL